MNIFNLNLKTLLPSGQKSHQFFQTLFQAGWMPRLSSLYPQLQYVHYLHWSYLLLHLLQCCSQFHLFNFLPQHLFLQYCDFQSLSGSSQKGFLIPLMKSVMIFRHFSGVKLRFLLFICNSFSVSLSFILRVINPSWNS